MVQYGIDHEGLGVEDGIVGDELQGRRRIVVWEQRPGVVFQLSGTPSHRI